MAARPYLKCEKIKKKNGKACVIGEVREGTLHIGDAIEVYCKMWNKYNFFEVVGIITEITRLRGRGIFAKKQSVTEAGDKEQVELIVKGIDPDICKEGSLCYVLDDQNNRAGKLPEFNDSFSFDSETGRLVSIFKNEFNEYFSGRGKMETVTQDLWHALLMQKKRLERLGIEMDIHRDPSENSFTIPMRTWNCPSGQYDVIEAGERVKFIRSYRVAGREILRDDEWRTAFYLLCGAKKNSDGLVECPNCGNFGTRESLLDGCDYCGTKFTVKDLSMRVAGFYQKMIPRSKMQKFFGRIDLGILTNPFSESNAKDWELELSMRQVDPLFSIHAFYNSVRNKLYSVVFSGNEREICALADEDFRIQELLPYFKDVIDINLISLETKKLDQNRDYILADVKVKTHLLRYDGEKTQWDSEDIMLSLVKAVSNKTKNIFEPSVVICEGCGASIDLYDGKKCPYCDREINLLEYDWLLVDMSCEKTMEKSGKI